MTKELSVSIPGKGPDEYRIVIGRGLLGRVAELFPPAARAQKIVIIVEPVLTKRWLPILAASFAPPIPEIIQVPGAEESKSYRTLELIHEKLFAAKCDKSSLIINFGGGVLTDVGGLAASLFHRGISFLNIPTTLLSQVDSSIGGKTGINFRGVKNLIGTVCQPAGVLVDLDLLSTLPDIQFRSGVAEMLKAGLIADVEYFRALVKSPLSPESPGLAESVRQACEIKRRIVETDPLDQGERRLLNFGHTLGHAFEALSHAENAPLTHGQAVALGCIGESYISFSRGRLSEAEMKEVRAGFAAYRLPVSIPESFDLERVIDLVQHDKKRVGKEVAWSLLHRLGKGSTGERVDTAEITAALEYLRIPL